MADVEIKFDERKLKNIQRQLRDVPRAMPKVMSRAINRTAKTMRVEIASNIVKKINITVSTAKKNITKTKARYGHWQSTISISPKRIPLQKFKARQTKKGISYKIMSIDILPRKSNKQRPLHTITGVNRNIRQHKINPGRVRIIKTFKQISKGQHYQIPMEDSSTSGRGQEAGPSIQPVSSQYR